jgi:hypothetical protein
LGNVNGVYRHVCIVQDVVERQCCGHDAGFAAAGGTHPPVPTALNARIVLVGMKRFVSAVDSSAMCTRYGRQAGYEQLYEQMDVY